MLVKMSTRKKVTDDEVEQTPPVLLRRSPRFRELKETQLREEPRHPNLESESVLKRRSPGFGKLIETQLWEEELKNPNLVPRIIVLALGRSPRTCNPGDAQLVEDPKTPNLESVRNQARPGRTRRSVVTPSSSHHNVSEFVDFCGTEKSVGPAMRGSQRLGDRGKYKEAIVEDSDGSKLGALKKKSNAGVNAAGGPENGGKATVALRRSSRSCHKKVDYTDADPKLDSVLDGIVQMDDNSNEESWRKSIGRSPVVLGGLENEGVAAKVATRGKGKRKRGKEGDGAVRGWTKEQETALERAYLAMKPTPHFWKKVSKMVGKSAQECFDRIHYDQKTPVLQRQKSKTKKASSPVSHFSLSASKVLGSPKATKKRKTRLGQKKIRELLQKQCTTEKDYDGDLFSILEGNLKSPFKVFQQTLGVPTPNAESFRRSSSRSSGRKKSVSRFSKVASPISPLVLKQVKNKALHEKYIDQLHCREAKRKAGLTRAKRTNSGKENLTPNLFQKPNIVKAAKTALESDATDVIRQFRELQNSPSSTADDFPISEDENEDEL